MARSAPALCLAAALAAALLLRPADAAKPLDSSWKTVTASFYGGADASGNMGGACGYGNDVSSTYGLYTAAASTALYSEGLACGQCFQVQCANSNACIVGKTVTVTVTNFCPNNWALPSNAGGWCNFPRQHLDMSQPAFTQIAQYSAGIVPVQVRRVPCLRSGSITFGLGGNTFWLQVNIRNVGGSGDISSVQVKGSGAWLTMDHEWGQNWSVDAKLGGQSLSFRLTTMTTGETLEVANAAPSSWQVGKTYQAGQFGSTGSSSSSKQKKVSKKNRRLF
eukprot:SM000003S10979  [mRNA]  locus=s3:98438:99271:+ [translate_table: standard]